MKTSMKRTIKIAMAALGSVILGFVLYAVIPTSPTTSELRGLIAESDSMVIKEFRAVSNASAMAVVYRSDNPEDLKTFSASLHLKKHSPFLSFRCMCDGTPVIYFYSGTNTTVHLSNHHGKSIRCSLWSSDVEIADNDAWAQWFEDRGISSVREELEDARVRAKLIKREREKWENAMPDGLKRTWRKTVSYSQGTKNVDPLIKTLEKLIPNRTQRILVLLEWYGSGEGPWSGYPFYEGTVGEMLLKYETKDVVEAIQSAELSPAQIEGGARLFGGGAFSRKHPNGLNEIPNEMKEMFWEHVRSTDDEDKLGRARRAFAKDG